MPEFLLFNMNRGLFKNPSTAKAVPLPLTREARRKNIYDVCF